MIKKNIGRWKGFKNEGRDFYVDRFGRKKFFSKEPDETEKSSFRRLSPDEIAAYRETLIEKN